MKLACMTDVRNAESVAKKNERRAKTENNAQYKFKKALY